MRSRAEIVNEAVELADDDACVLWALSVNAVPMRRTYLEAVVDRTPRQIVKCLARLANAGLLSSTDGLLFAIEDERVRDLVAERIPENVSATLASQSLEFGATCEDMPEMFFVDHALRAGQPIQAAKRLLNQLPGNDAEDPPIDEDVAASLLRVFVALQGNDATLGVNLSVGRALVGHCATHIRPRAWRDLIAALEKHPETDDSFRATLQAADVQFKKRRSVERKEAALASVQEEALPTENSDV